jgi:hypothetical protein
MRKGVRCPKSNQTGIWRGKRPPTTRSISASIGDGAKQRLRPAAEETCARARPKSRFAISGLPGSDCVGPNVRNRWCFCPLNPCHTSAHVVEFPIRIGPTALGVAPGTTPTMAHVEAKGDQVRAQVASEMGPVPGRANMTAGEAQASLAPKQTTAPSAAGQPRKSPASTRGKAQQNPYGKDPGGALSIKGPDGKLITPSTVSAQVSNTGTQNRKDISDGRADVSRNAGRETANAKDKLGGK